jgi:ATP-dependent Clp protease adaptor protein ClpS
MEDVESWLTVFGMGTTALTALGLCLRRAHRVARAKMSPAAMDTLTVGILDAQERGHRPFTVTHWALGLLTYPNLVSELERRGVRLLELYEDVERLLPAREEAPTILTGADADPPIGELIRAACDEGFGLHRATPEEVFFALLRSKHETLKAVFAQHGVTSERWTADALAAPPAAPAHNVSAGGVGGPYRGTGAQNDDADADVVFWNDARTTMPFVAQLLRETFGIVGPHTMQLVLAVHRDGYAIVGTYPREEAASLAAIAERSARAHGFPLKVSVDTARHVRSLGRSRRWLASLANRRLTRQALEAIVALPSSRSHHAERR